MLDNSISIKRIINLSRFVLPHHIKDNCRKLVDVEGHYRLEPIAKVSQEIINDLGLTNVESIGNLELYLDDGFSYYNGKLPIQVLSLDLCGSQSVSKTI